MKGILIDKNNFDAFISLEDGSTLVVPATQINNSNVGDSIRIPQEGISISSNVRLNNNLGNDKLIDFF